ncbi:ubiquitin-conjugating enzyme/RWD-like protein [Triangularia setosa]|uniref:Ubiquitin-conjugating enzyme/RWD-like protein n=1 Tax=Triangularia setosa TaxID=2587417 RepID=A0AAN6WB15_9PEZI|nr:ubiquitin-conjugating enzyme/RWD-like protein [Podospora setosa]
MSSRSKPSSSASAARAAIRRLAKEFASIQSQLEDGQQEIGEGIERLGPPDQNDLLHWEAVINGRGLGGGYADGRWLLKINIPPTYPLSPPEIKFTTSIVHSNVKLETGEICLDLLKDAWTPAYTVLECVKAVRMLLDHPGVDSPLNVDVAALLREGDERGARGLVELWIGDVEGGKYEGE